MKRLLILYCVFLILVPIVRNNWEYISVHSHEAVDQITFPFKIAQLHAKEPDQKLSMPVASLKRKQITDTWQASRSTNRRHEGQDLFAPRGTAVYSATDGYVVRIGENRLGGKTVSVIGAGGRVYYYAHLDSYAPDLAVGDQVNTDSILGYVGNTGNAQGTPPHLHFGVYTLQGAINPLPLLANRS